MAIIHTARLSPDEQRQPEAIRAIAMTTAAFVGEGGAGPVLQPVVIESWRGYLSTFGTSPTKTWLSDAVHGFFLNGGMKLVICNLGEPANIVDRSNRFLTALQALEAQPEVALVAAPGCTDPGLQELLLLHCEALRTRLAILDGPQELDLGGIQRLPKPRDSTFGVYYFPWIYVHEPDWGARCAPPSGHLAGLLARVERERGLHRAPVNEILRGAVGIRHPVSRADEEFLTPRGINCVRDLGERGIRVFGARTLSCEREAASVPARRLAAMIERAIERGAYELLQHGTADDAAELIETAVRRFMGRLRDQGLLAGATPEESFSAHCEVERLASDPGSGELLICTVRFTPTGTSDSLAIRLALPVAVGEVMPTAAGQAG